MVFVRVMVPAGTDWRNVLQTCEEECDRICDDPHSNLIARIVFYSENSVQYEVINLGWEDNKLYLTPQERQSQYGNLN